MIGLVSAQTNIQLHYDVERKYNTSTLEMFKLDKYGSIFKKFGVALPTTVLIDSDGKIAYYFEGYTEKTIEELSIAVSRYKKEIPIKTKDEQ